MTTPSYQSPVHDGPCQQPITFAPTSNEGPSLELIRRSFHLLGDGRLEFCSPASGVGFFFAGVALLVAALRLLVDRVQPEFFFFDFTSEFCSSASGVAEREFFSLISLRYFCLWFVIFEFAGVYRGSFLAYL